MPIFYDELINRPQTNETRFYEPKELQLYALGVGMGMDPCDQQQLAFLRDDDPKVLPTFATLAAWDIGFTRELGMAWAKLIHVSHRLEINAPLPPSAEIIVSTRCKAAFDKPNQNATLLVNETRMVNAVDGKEWAVLENVYLARDFRLSGAPTGRPEALPSPPSRKPDVEVPMPTSPQVALIYRLLGGRAPIHCDPGFARAEGFDGPIMHGLSTFGHVCHAVLRGACDDQPERLCAIAADFRAPVYPGETLLVRIWLDGGRINFDALVPERDVVVVANGTATRDG